MLTACSWMRCRVSQCLIQLQDVWHSDNIFTNFEAVWNTLSSCSLLLNLHVFFQVKLDWRIFAFSMSRIKIEFRLPFGCLRLVIVCKQTRIRDGFFNWFVYIFYNLDYILILIWPVTICRVSAFVYFFHVRGMSEKFVDTLKKSWKQCVTLNKII